jgi:hypothetical protein
MEGDFPLHKHGVAADENSDDGSLKELPSACRKWLAAEGYQPKAVPDDDVNVALMALLKPTTGAEGSSDDDEADDDPLSSIGQVPPVDTSWGELKKQIPPMVLRKPMGLSVMRAFETTLDLAESEAERLKSLGGRLEEANQSIYELEQAKKDDVQAKLAVFERKCFAKAEETSTRLKELQSELDGFGADQKLMNAELKQQETDTTRALGEMTVDVSKERRRNIQERFAMAIVMSRLDELKHSLHQNTVGDKELRLSVEAMQQQLATGQTAKEFEASLLAQQQAAAAEEEEEDEEASAGGGEQSAANLELLAAKKQLNEMNEHMRRMAEASEEANKRMKEQADSFLARERSVAELEEKARLAREEQERMQQRQLALAERLKERRSSMEQPTVVTTTIVIVEEEAEKKEEASGAVEDDRVVAPCASPKARASSVQVPSMIHEGNEEDDNDEETHTLNEKLKEYELENARRLAEAAALKQQLEDERARLAAAEEEKRLADQSADVAWSKLNNVTKVRRSSMLAMSRSVGKINKPVAEEEEEEEAAPPLEEDEKKNAESPSSKRWKSAREVVAAQNDEEDEEEDEEEDDDDDEGNDSLGLINDGLSVGSDDSWQRRQSQSQLQQQQQPSTVVDLNITPLVTRVEDLESATRARCLTLEGLERSVAGLTQVSSEQTALGLQREERLAGLKKRVEQLETAKADKTSVQFVAKRVEALEKLRQLEEEGGLNIGEIGKRIELLERAAADLRVRGVLERQVQALSDTKADAVEFTNRLHDLGRSLQHMVEEVRHDDRRAVDSAVRTIAERQDETSVAFDRFTSKVDSELNGFHRKLSDVALEAAAPKLLAMLKAQTANTVEAAVAHQAEKLAKQGKSLKGLHEDLNRVPDEVGGWWLVCRLVVVVCDC